MNSYKHCERECIDENEPNECKYFVYYTNARVCRLYSSANRTCDLIRGPPNPSLEDCSPIGTAMKIKRKFE